MVGLQSSSQRRIRGASNFMLHPMPGWHPNPQSMLGCSRYLPLVGWAVGCLQAPQGTSLKSLSSGEGLFTFSVCHYFTAKYGMFSD